MSSTVTLTHQLITVCLGEHCTERQAREMHVIPILNYQYSAPIWPILFSNPITHFPARITKRIVSLYLSDSGEIPASKCLTILGGECPRLGDGFSLWTLLKCSQMTDVWHTLCWGNSTHWLLIAEVFPLKCEDEGECPEPSIRLTDF